MIATNTRTTFIKQKTALRHLTLNLYYFPHVVDIWMVNQVIIEMLMFLKLFSSIMGTLMLFIVFGF